MSLGAPQGASNGASKSRLLSPKLVLVVTTVLIESGEAVVLSRWVPNAKVRLLQPATLLRKASL